MLTTEERPSRAELREPDLVVSVVIPCLDEAETIDACVAKAQAGIRALGRPGEVVVADNGSSDGSQQLARDAGARVVAVDERGYGAALMGGIRAARGRYVVMADADDTYDLAGIKPFVTSLEDGHDLVLGNRFSGGIAAGAMPRLNRLIGNPVLTGLGRLFFRSPVGDFHCGLRAFRRDAILQLGLSSSGMEFASEMVVKATLAGLRITEVPTTLVPGRDGRQPHLRPWRDGWRHLRLLLLYSPTWLFLYPGIALFLAGLGVTIALLPGAITFGSIRFDVHTLLYAQTGAVLGSQTIIFAVLAKVFGISQGLLPENPRLTKIARWVTLERGLALGGLLLVAGFAGSILAVFRWGQHSFGHLNYEDTLRIAIPSVGLFVIGFQTVVASFFLSFLGLTRRGR